MRRPDTDSETHAGTTECRPRLVFGFWLRSKAIDPTPSNAERSVAIRRVTFG